MHKPIILIVDDEFPHIEAMMDVFEETESNYRVLTATRGENALKIAVKEIPDLIITDWEMPVMNGIEFIKQLKLNKRTIDIPVIMCTGVMTTSENLQTALNAGAVDYIRKPVDKIELIARTKANLHLAEKYNEVKKLNKTKDDIFTVIAHDLKGPVGSVKSFTDMILKNESNYNHEEFVDFVKLIGKQTASAYSVLENLMAWANCHRDNIEFQPRKQKIKLVANSNIELLTEIANRKNITINNEINGGILAVFDMNLISTVIRNLISNAIKFTKRNGTITLKAEEKESYITVLVCDTGIGISPERINKLFDKTTYETTYGTDAEKGSGLGLKLSKDFIEKHGGKIWVESEVGKGSVFTFTIPKA